MLAAGALDGPFSMFSLATVRELEEVGVADVDEDATDGLSMVVVAAGAVGVELVADESELVAEADLSDSSFLTTRLWHSSGAKSKVLWSALRSKTLEKM